MNSKLLVALLGFVLTGYIRAQSLADSVYISADTTASLIAYYPHNVTMDLAFAKMPDCSDDKVLFCAEAAFTGKLLDTFSHSNILGVHIASGVRYEGYEEAGNYALFAFYNGKWKFSDLSDSALLDTVVANQGMAFTQHWVIKDGEIAQPQIQKDEASHFYRVIAEVRGRLCVIDSRKNVPYKYFMQSLRHYGVKNALYMDMGPGWNHSCWRDEKGVFHEIHPVAERSKYCTNWIVMRK